MQPDKEELFDNVIFLVTRGELVFLIEAPPLLFELMDRDLLDDNCSHNTMKKFPKEHGFYKCSIRYYFEQGWYEGYKADGESEWDFIPNNIVKVNPSWL